MSKGNQNILVILGIIIFTLLLYSNSLTNDFVANWDDNQYVLNNSSIKEFSKENVSALVSSYYVGNYHPVTMLVFAVEYKFFGANPMPFHLVNLILHLINVLLVFLIFQRISGGRLLVSAIVALLFGIHPMHVESVSWISSLKDVLYSVFFLGSLWFYLIYIDKRKFKNYILSLLLFLLALLSKSMAVTLPLVLILIDYYMSRRPLVKHFSEKIPFFVMSLIFGVLAIMSQKEGITYDEVSSHFSWVERVFLVNYAILFYPLKIFAPFNLSMLHLYPIKVAGILPIHYYILPALTVLIIWGITRIARASRNNVNKNSNQSFLKVVIFGVLYYLITISIVIQIIPVGRAIVAERYSYLPYLGLFFIIAQGFYLTWKREYRYSKVLRPYIILGLVFLIVASTYATINRNKVWSDDVSLFEDMVKKNSDRAYGYYALGKTAEDEENIEVAMEYYDKSLELDSTFVDAYYNRGNLRLFYYEQYQEAVTDLEKAVEFDNEFKLAFNNLSIAYRYIREFDKALTALDRVIELDPTYAQGYFNRGYIYNQIDEYNAAIVDLSKAIELSPDYPKAFFQRGRARHMISDFNGALNDLLVVKSTFPDNPGLILMIGDIRFDLNDLQGACNEWNISAGLGHKIAMEKLKEYCK